MKIEKCTKPVSTPAAHPLKEAADATNNLAVGDSVRLSQLPMGYSGLNAEYLTKALREAGMMVTVEIEYGDNASTPSSYIVTRVS